MRSGPLPPQKQVPTGTVAEPGDNRRVVVGGLRTRRASLRGWRRSWVGSKRRSPLPRLSRGATYGVGSANGHEGWGIVRFEYDVQIAGRTVGAYLLEDDGSELRQRVDFETEDGEISRSEHLVRRREGRPVAYRAGTAEWVDCSHMPASHWPTAAYPLLLEARVTEYMAIDEETGEVAPRTLEYAEGRVEERQADRLVRAFDLRDGNVARIDWGGAISELQSVHPG